MQGQGRGEEETQRSSKSEKKGNEISSAFF